MTVESQKKLTKFLQHDRKEGNEKTVKIKCYTVVNTASEYTAATNRTPDYIYCAIVS